MDDKTQNIRNRNVKIGYPYQMKKYLLECMILNGDLSTHRLAEYYVVIFQIILNSEILVRIENFKRQKGNIQKLVPRQLTPLRNTFLTAYRNNWLEILLESNELTEVN